MNSLLRRSLPLAFALVATLASAQRVTVGTAYRDDTTHDSAGGTAPYTTYSSSVDHDDYGQYFQRATARADFRTIKLTARVEGSGSANANASITDKITIGRPEGGGWGVAYAWVRAHADTTAQPYDDNPYDYTSASGQSTALLSLSLGANSFTWKQQADAFNYWPQGEAAYGQSYTDTRIEMANRMPDGSVNFWKPTVYGDSFYLPFYFQFGGQYDLKILASARAHLFNGGVVDTNFANTYQWQGIDRVYALNGDGTQSLVSDWTIGSLSGTDYSSPVPEPASMVALGTGAIALFRRRRQV